MTADDQPRTSEGDLIRHARERTVPKLSIRAAAARIGISPEHWGNVERGYKATGAHKQPQPLDASAVLLAKMASTVGVTPSELEEAGRDDAARELKELQSRERPPRTRVNASLRRTPELIRYIHEIAEERAAGTEPRDGEARVWDTDLMSEEEKWNFLATMRLLNDTSARESSTGLSLSPDPGFLVTARSRRRELACCG